APPLRGSSPSRCLLRVRGALPARAAELPCEGGMSALPGLRRAARGRWRRQKMLPLRLAARTRHRFHGDREKLFSPGILRRLPDPARNKVALFEFPNSVIHAPQRQRLLCGAELCDRLGGRCFPARTESLLHDGANALECCCSFGL